MINLSSLAKNLITIMKSNGITTSQLSQDIGIPEITINKLRNGQNTNPTISTLLPITEYFNISLDYLFANKDDKKENKKQIINMNGSISDEFFDLEQYVQIIENIDFMIKVDSNNYMEYKKDSLLLIRKQNIINEDIVIIKINNCLMPCKAVIECGILMCKSLIFVGKFYRVNVNEILGVIVGIIWKRN